MRRLQSAELQKERSMYERMVGGNGKDKKKKPTSVSKNYSQKHYDKEDRLEKFFWN